MKCAVETEANAPEQAHLDRLIEAIEREEKEDLLKQFVESLQVQAERRDTNES